LGRSKVQHESMASTNYLQNRAFEKALMLKTMNEVKNFMNREWLATFSTVNAMNEPCVVPVFFTYNDGKVYIQTDRNSVKVHNLLMNDNVAIAVFRDDEAVIVRGTARIVDGEEFVRRTRNHIGKYGLKLNEHGRDSLGIPLFDSKVRCVVEVTPKRLMYW
jgi:nitroimidazol reductase NimA-like FMN-containing flavoprotein (pyridoxamine 5'-phosphate oxidase superfamily)